MGYKRPALSAVITRGALPKIDALYRVSKQFGIPMDYWFPSPVKCKESVVAVKTMQSKKQDTDRSYIEQEIDAIVTALDVKQQLLVLRVLRTHYRL
jgi:transcriptional regulator with XRE-family HTH domain